MTLEAYILSLDEGRRLAAAVHFCALALPIWETYSEGNALRYVDTVVGMQHFVDPGLLQQVLDLARGRPEPGLAALEAGFLDPIVALQDDDWDLPEEVRLTFYAHYNLLEHLAGRHVSMFGEASLYVAVNQAADALDKASRMDFARMRQELERFAEGRAPEDGRV